MERPRMTASAWGIVFTVIGLIVMFLALPYTCRVDESVARHVLQDAGYTDIQIGGYGWMRCGESDSFRTEFVARRGDRIVHGAVCGGLNKDYTVRLSGE